MALKHTEQHIIFSEMQNALHLLHHWMNAALTYGNLNDPLMLCNLCISMQQKWQFFSENAIFLKNYN